MDFTRPSVEVDVIAVDSGEGDPVVAAHPNGRSHPKVHEGTVASMIRYAPPISLGKYLNLKALIIIPFLQTIPILRSSSPTRKPSATASCVNIMQKHLMRDFHRLLTVSKVTASTRTFWSEALPTTTMVRLDSQNNGNHFLAQMELHSQKC